MSSQSFTIFALPNEAGESRLGITVTRKVGNAARRNRIKRRFRDVFRRNRAKLVPPMDLVVNAHRDIDPDDHAGIEAEFLRAFERLARPTRKGCP